MARLWAHIGIITYISILTHAGRNCKRKRADLLRQIFNFWTDSGNPAKIIKRRFRDELRTYNTPIIILVKHITIFALEVARLRNKAILHGITSIFLYFDFYVSAYRVQSVFIWRCTSSNNARTIIQRRFLSRAVRLYYLQTIQSELFTVFRKLSQ